MYKVGLYDTYMHKDKTDTIEIFTDINADFSEEKPYTVKYKTFPAYDPGEEEWEEPGIFADTTHSYSPLTTIIRSGEEYNETEEADSVKSSIKQLEKNSRKVLFTDINLIFYATPINGKWYLTIIDRISTDVGA